MFNGRLRWAIRFGLLVTVLLAGWSSVARADKDCQMCDTCTLNGQQIYCCDHFLPAGSNGCFAVAEDFCWEYGGSDCGVQEARATARR